MKNQIYKIVNLVNGKFYIGLTTIGIKKRFEAHIASANSNKDTLIARAIRKYGRSNFEYEIIVELEKPYTIELLSELEKHYIQLYNSTNKNIGYNLCSGGVNKDGTIYQKSVRERMSLIKKNSPRIGSMYERKRVKVINKLTLESKIYTCQADCAKELNVTPRYLSYQLKYNRDYKDYTFERI